MAADGPGKGAGAVGIRGVNRRSARHERRDGQHQSKRKISHGLPPCGQWGCFTDEAPTRMKDGFNRHRFLLRWATGIFPVAESLVLPQGESYQTIKVNIGSSPAVNQNAYLHCDLDINPVFSRHPRSLTIN